MSREINEFLAGRRFAVLGASQTSHKVGNSIVADLVKKGYSVYVVHPSADEIDGHKCYASLAELKGMVDGVILCIPPEKALPVVEAAAQAGISRLWLQEGSESLEVLAAAYAAGMSVVVNRCIMMYTRDIS
jgi:predicted CoA-binding protein